MCVPACSVAQSCLTLCDPIDCSPPGSSVGILQASTVEQVAINIQMLISEYVPLTISNLRGS